MALSKRTFIGRLEILEDAVIQVREHMVIEEDGVPITEPKFHRRVFVPGTDLSRETLPGADRLRAVAGVLWTPEVIAAYAERQRLAQEDAIRERTEGRTR